MQLTDVSNGYQFLLSNSLLFRFMSKNEYFYKYVKSDISGKCLEIEIILHNSSFSIQGVLNSSLGMENHW